ncbi:MAG: shikimate dehydrogenase family protein [Propionibacteriaceae bacterium]
MTLRFKLGIIGNPVAGSHSPELYSGLAENLSYARIVANSAAHGIELAHRWQLAGLNVTAPFKKLIPLLDHVDYTALRVGAVNTVAWRNGASYGFNSDISGVTGALANRVSVATNAVVLGAGGAARAAVVGLQNMGATVCVINRTLASATALSEELGCQVADFSQRAAYVSAADVIVDCLSSRDEIIPASAWRPSHSVLIARYPADNTARSAQAAGAWVRSGEAWLANQAVGCWQIWSNQHISADVFYNRLSQLPKRTSEPTITVGYADTAPVIGDLTIDELISIDELAPRLAYERSCWRN